MIQSRQPSAYRPAESSSGGSCRKLYRAWSGAPRQRVSERELADADQVTQHRMRRQCVVPGRDDAPHAVDVVGEERGGRADLGGLASVACIGGRVVYDRADQLRCLGVPVALREDPADGQPQAVPSQDLFPGQALDPVRDQRHLAPHEDVVQGARDQVVGLVPHPGFEHLARGFLALAVFLEPARGAGVVLAPLGLGQLRETQP